jgi:hypothetical protein
MISNFDYVKGQEFINRTQQYPHILKGVRNINSINYLAILKTMENKSLDETVMFLSYYDTEQLYCKIIMDFNYNVPFTLDELLFCFCFMKYLKQSCKNKKRHLLAKQCKRYSPQAYLYARKLRSKLLKEYTLKDINS